MVGAQVLLAVGLGAQNFLTAAFLGPTGKGQATFAISGSSLGAFLLFLSLHVGASLAARSGDVRGLMRGLVLAVGLAAPPCAGAALLFSYGGPGVGPLSSHQAALALTGLGASVLALYLTRTVQSLWSVKAYRGLIALQTLTYLGATGVFITLGLTATLLIAAWLLSSIVAVAAALPIFVTLYRRLYRTDRRAQRLSVLKPAASAHLGAIGNQLLYRADVLILGVLVAPASVGVYAVGRAIAELIWVLAEAFALSTFGEGAEHLTSGRRSARLNLHITNYCRVALLAAVIIGSASWPALHFLLPEFESAFIITLILIPGTLVGGVGRILLSGAMAADQRQLLRSVGTLSALASMLYVPFIALFGSVGAAVASLILYCAQTAYLQRRVAWTAPSLVRCGAARRSSQSGKSVSR